MNPCCPASAVSAFDDVWTTGTPVRQRCERTVTLAARSHAGGLAVTPGDVGQHLADWRFIAERLCMWKIWGRGWQSCRPVP